MRVEKTRVNRTLRSVSVFAMALGMMQYASAANLTQQQLTAFAQGATAGYAAVSNFGKPTAKFTLENTSSVDLPAGKGDWRIYLHSVRKIEPLDAHGLSIRFVQGDLHEVIPTDSFKGLKRGERVELTYTANATFASYTDFMPRAFIAQPGLNPEVFATTDTEDMARFIEPFVTPEQQLRAPAGPDGDLYPIATTATRFADNKALTDAVATISAAPRIIPTPADVKYRSGVADIDSSWRVRYVGAAGSEFKYLTEQLKTFYGLTLDGDYAHKVKAGAKQIDLAVNPAIGASESYTLDIKADRIQITGADAAGVFYGVQSVLSLLPAETASSYKLPQLTANDAPRYGWRGMHYDMGRNFHGKDYTLRMIEQMARYKLNKLHLHLTEDEGWRIEIPGLPELTEIGAFRCFDLTEQRCLLTQLGTGPHRTGSGNGYYSKADFVEILKFARDRHIEVIPEIDMPGHARAAVKSMEARYHRLMKAGDKAGATQFLLTDMNDKSQYLTVQNYTDNSVNVCLESTYAFTDKVVYELQQMYREAGAKLHTFHMGGDEVGKGSWTASPACAALIAKGEAGVAGVGDLKPYFVSRLAEITNKRGLALAGWEDGLMYDATSTFNRAQFDNKKVLANAWDNIWEWGVGDRAYRLANAGYDVVLSLATHLYFDHPYEANAHERGYYWATRYTDTQKVFGLMPDNLYANADRTRMGAEIDDLEALLGKPMPKLEKPEHILGIQGQVWTETIRTGEQMEQMIYPRLMSLAERAWHKAPWEGEKPDQAARFKDWANFALQLSTKELPKLAKLGGSFYLPPAGGQRDDGTLDANSSLPGTRIEYSLDGGNSWSAFNGKVHVGDKKALLRTRIGAITSRTTEL
jgi:hexosaminidase